MVELSPIAGRTSRISASAFAGRADTAAQPDPVTTSLIDKNSLQLGIVSNQIQGMSAQMNALANSLQVIAGNLSTSQSIERQKEAQEQALESKLAEEKLREGKESVIEKKIQAAAIAPAQKLASTAQFTLGRLGQFFGTLLGGWLVIKTLDFIKDLSADNNKRLNELKETVLKNVSQITGIFTGFKDSISTLSKSFSGIGSRLVSISAAGLFTNPFEQFFEVLKEGGRRVWNKVTGFIPGNDNNSGASEEPASSIDPNAPPTAENIQSGQTPSAETTPAAEVTAPESKQEAQKLDPNKPPENNLTGMGGPSLPTEMLMGGNINQAETGSNVVSSTINPNKLLGKKEEGGGENQKAEFDPSLPPESGTTKLEPEETADKESKEEKPAMQADLSKGIDSTKLFDNGKSFAEVGFSVDASVQSFVDTEKYVGKFGKLPVDMFTPMKRDEKLAEKVGPAPEPPVNVVPVPAETQQPAQSQAQSQPVKSGGSAGNAPSFATSNRDNIYVLGAMSNFNVVMA